MWRRVDQAGAEQVLLSDGSGLHARGTQVCADPIPFTCRYELYTDNTWATARFEATVEGPGFSRSTRLERASGRWRVTASEQGDLDAALRAVGRARAGLPGIEEVERLAPALDIDLAGSPLTNTLPVRRLGMLKAATGTSHRLDVAYIVVPSLEVIPAVQTYATTGGLSVHYASGTFQVDIELDADGYVTHYPGRSERA
jgi:hypothetical protein